ncbi:hypothetical protein FVE85_9015 [Porphyridium purpureum]|uniref:Uncharacterized protein n=1 Tax=Porphyridium purpureum TaxID=35688 RepID=A0A5J4YPU9_PORPP|nr:hypothetical protein FVE85_9015 [Porphyridium purpureum]|eukprot:POR3593..scf222_8
MESGQGLSVPAGLKWERLQENVSVSEQGTYIFFRVRFPFPVREKQPMASAAGFRSTYSICGGADVPPVVLNSRFEGSTILGMQLWVSISPLYSSFESDMAPFNANILIRDNELIVASDLAQILPPEKFTDVMVKNGANLIIARIDQVIDKPTNTRLFFVLQRKISPQKIVALKKRVMAQRAASKYTPRKKDVRTLPAGAAGGNAGLAYGQTTSTNIALGKSTSTYTGTAGMTVSGMQRKLAAEAAAAAAAAGGIPASSRPLQQQAAAAVVRRTMTVAEKHASNAPTLEALYRRVATRVSRQRAERPRERLKGIPLELWESVDDATPAAKKLNTKWILYPPQPIASGGTCHYGSSMLIPGTEEPAFLRLRDEYARNQPGRMRVNASALLSARAQSIDPPNLEYRDAIRAVLKYNANMADERPILRTWIERKAGEDVSQERRTSENGNDDSDSD